ncbi:MAG: hypothetical protein KGO94_03745 [Alphaproteobacteria bacterium]|nr:hypothetical protein [Alphaproteobacteria bacterium]
MRNSFLAVIGVLTLADFVGVAFAAEPVAEIEYVSGRVLINTGDGMNAIAMNDVLHAGDQLLIGHRGSLTLRFPAQNCAISYAESSVVVVPAKAVCKNGDFLAAAGNDFAQPTNFGATTIYGGANALPAGPIAIGLGVEAAAIGVAIKTNFINKPPTPVSAP